jgi:hypothetical protein
MKKGQTSTRGGVQDFLCPFTDMYITQGSMNNFSHKGIYANDVRGSQAGVKYPYYAPCDLVCIKTYPESGQVMWQSQNKVRFANGRIDYATIMTAHDDSMDSYAGQKLKQGAQMGNMGTKGYATGVHCHIEISQSKTTTWTKNQYGNYMFPNEYDLDDCYFVDDTNILEGFGGNWKKTSDVKVVEPTTVNKDYVNLPPSIDSWKFYALNVKPVKANAKGSLNPKKFGGLSYYVYEYRDNNTTAVINTVQFGKVKIYIANTCATITKNSHTYKNGNY